MKIVVIGGTGLIGSKLVRRLREAGHEVVAASPSAGIDVVTGQGLAAALAGAQVVVDVANAPSFADAGVLAFFRAAGRNLLTAEAAAGVRHHVALSVVGTERLTESGYFRAKLVQEELIRASGIPYTVVRATQFFEFLGSIAHDGTDGQTVRLSPALVQPIASDDVADAVADFAIGAPVGGIAEIAGPARFAIPDLVQRFLRATKDPRTVVSDAHARYFGAALAPDTLLPGAGARLGRVDFSTWIARAETAKPV